MRADSSRAAPLLPVVCVWAACAGAPDPTAVVYAASSLRDALASIAPLCEQDAGVRLVVNFGASSDLARQIEAAGKADLFISADVEQIDRLAARGLIDPSTRRDLLSNRLVVIAPADSALRIRSAADLASPAVRRLSLAAPDAVPAGRYARSWLERSGQWETLKGRVVPALDARAAMAAVASGAVDAGIVYATDAAVSAKVRVLHEVPGQETRPIRYVMAVMSGRPSSRDTARRVAACLGGPDAASAFRRHGFIVLPGVAGPP